MTSLSSFASSLVSSWLFGSDPSPRSDPIGPRQRHIQDIPVLDDDEQTPEQALNALLEQFKTSTVPAASRFNGDLDPQREGSPPRVLDFWRHALFVATKTKDIVQDVALHHLRGPRRPSWNIEMTMLAAFMRNMASNTHLIDIPTLRFAMSLGGMIPTPSDALITPVTFRVRKRRLRGFLTKWDELETGKREIQSEWVVGKRLWQRLQREWKGLQQQQQRGGNAAFVTATPHVAGRSSFRHTHSSHHHHHNKVKERVVLFLHGGAYYTASAATHRLITIALSKHLDARVFAINYRLAPDTRFPGPVHDAVSAYLRLTEDLGVPPGNVIVAGDSAGGGLCVALMMYLRDEGYPLPGAAILMCPWVDLTMSCASWETNADVDVITFPTDPADHMNPVACYLGPQGMSRFMTHPYASPLFGDFTGLPPLFVQAGDCEVLRDEGTLLAHKATLAGVDVVHEVYEDAVHVFQLYPFLEQSRKAFRACRRFVLETLPAIQAKNKEKERALSRHASATTFDSFALGFGLGIKGVSTPMEEVPSVDVPVPTPTHTPVSPPLTPTALTPRRLDGIATPSESGASVDDRSTSSSDDARLSERVETALEREISGTGTDHEPIVVDAYGTEEPRSRASSMSVGRPDDEDESTDEDDVSLPLGSSGLPEKGVSNTDTAPRSPPASHPGSSRTQFQHRTHRTTSAFALTPLARLPPVPETRLSLTMSTFLTLPRVQRPRSSSHLSTKSHFGGGSLGVDNNDDRDGYGDAATTLRGSRERTTSHPDMVKLMREYARMGPAQMTTTYARQTQTQTPSSAAPGSGITIASPKFAATTSTTQRSRGECLSDAIRKGASASASTNGHKPAPPASPVQ